MSMLLQRPYLFVGFVVVLAFGIERMFALFRKPISRRTGQEASDAVREEQNAVLFAALLISAIVIYQRISETYDREHWLVFVAASLCGGLGLAAIACAVTGWRATSPKGRAIAIVKALAASLTLLVFR